MMTATQFCVIKALVFAFAFMWSKPSGVFAATGNDSHDVALFFLVTISNSTKKCQRTQSEGEVSINNIVYKVNETL